MIFSSFTFLIFLIVVILQCVVLPQKYRKFVLLGASYFFYGYWDIRFTLLIFASTTIDYIVGIYLDNSKTVAKRKFFLVLSLSSNLGMLFFFKYYNFFIDSAADILSRWDIGTSNLDIILPVGISFFTFQTMSYSIDIYRGKIKPVTSFSDFALFVAFFPQLVAGPIVRASEFLPQLNNPIKIEKFNLWAGSQIFIIGLFKKLIVADSIAPLVDQVYANPSYFSSTTVWLAIIAYAIQIYCDFSGYSDMAIGCARMLGFRLNRNFNMPYLSVNITEFWRRWHISLSSWLRDYLYISLGGNRNGDYRTYRNLMITMILGGLWHGASWNFIFWGAFHGVALSMHREWSRHNIFNVPTDPVPSVSNCLTRTVSTMTTLLFVCLTWVFFRSNDIETTVTIFSKLFFISSQGVDWIYIYAVIAIIICIIGHIVGTLRDEDEHIYFSRPSSFVAAFTVCLVLTVIYVFAPTNVSPFIYFQF